MPKVSVLIPVYNLADLLPACLDSVLAQDFSDFEVIAVNDGSTDDSIEVLQRYKRRLSGLTIIDQPNQGLAATRNAGLRSASGEFICFLDNDDSIAPNFISSLLAAAESTNAPLSICNFFIVEDAQKRVAPFPAEPAVASGRAWLRHVYYTRDFLPVVWRQFVRRDFIEANNLRFPAVRHAEDHYWTSTVLACADTVASVPRPLYNYVQRPGSMARAKDDRWLALLAEAQVEIAEGLDRFIREGRGNAECYPELRWKIADNLLGVANHYRNIGDARKRSALVALMRRRGFTRLLWRHARGFRQKRRAIKRMAWYASQALMHPGAQSG